MTSDNPPSTRPPRRRLLGSTAVRTIAVTLLLTAATAVAPAQAAAAPFATAPGTNRAVITPQPGLNRTSTVYRPVTAGANAPLVVMVHGKSSTGQEMRRVGMDTVADREGFVVVYPDAHRKLWNAGDECCRTPSMPEVDDVKFLHDLTQQLIAEDGVDPDRIYAVGYSAGGVLVYKWACERSGLAGIGPVGGAVLGPCAAPAPLTLVAVHGAADGAFPVNGGVSDSGEPIPSLDQTMAPFKTAAACPTDPTSTESIGRMSIASWSCASGLGVVRSIVAGEKHGWPGATGKPGYPATATDTSDFIWTRFESYAPTG